jgi:membrane-bound lytic murein transglycosylase A
MARLLAPLAILSLAACQTPPSAPEGGVTMSLAPVALDQVAGWREDHPAEAVPAFLAGCNAMQGGADQRLGGAGEAAARGGLPEHWRAACTAARALPPGDDPARDFFETYFDAWSIGQDGGATGRFTGYYEPELNGARSPGGAYRTPLMSRPNDMVQVDVGAFLPDLKGKRLTGRVERGALVPYWDRAAIVGGALDRQRLGILWVADPVDAFVLQIQGSGRVRLPDGRVVRVSYDGQNGRPYVPIGRVLADRGAIPLERVTMQSIRAWLAANPAETAGVLNQNPSYVFFREISRVAPTEGPPGALGAPLTPARSIAVDRAFVPLGAPVWIDTTDPVTGAPLRRLMMAQDTGGAIKGPVRADVFWGWGADAEDRAGRMNQKGTATILLPRAPGN